MRTNRQRALWLSISILGSLSLSPVLLGQAAPRSEAAVPATTDWSQHHVVFSRPGTPEQIRRVERDPRYWQQLARHAPARLPEAQNGSVLASKLRPGVDASATKKTKDNIKRDWSQDLGPSATVGAGNYPAKFSFDSTTANCTNDFVVYGTGLLSSGTQASIVAYNNLYSGCIGGGAVPSVYWAYNTGSTIVTSPVFSLDGKQVAFVETNGAGTGSLVLLKWAASATETVGAPQTLFPRPRGGYQGCTAPCFTALPLRNVANSGNNSDTTSSVFYDYTDDAAYVGDAAGQLHKFTPVFKGTPTEVRNGSWPVQVSTGPTALTDPVYDSGSGNVFVEDREGFLYAVDSTTASVTQSGQLDFSLDADGGPGFVQGPIVDSTAGLVYAFVPSDGTQACAIGANPFDCAGVFQLTTTFPPGSPGSEEPVGASTVELTTPSPSPLYIGAFDSTYEESVNATGNLYVCGNTGGPPILYQVAIKVGAFVGVSAGTPLSTATTPCSPVTDVFNPNASGGPTEWIFVSPETGGASSACASGGCIFNFKDTPWLPSTAYVLGQQVVDTHFQIQVVSHAGTSAASTPPWTTTLGSTTADGTVLRWVNQGPASAFTPAAWQAGHLYNTLHALILDGNGNIEMVTTRGTSGGSLPAFNATPGGTTHDGTVIWTNVGVPATAALSAAGGTSGIILDNTVGSGVLPGASQIYFSTLSGGCGSGTDGCAVQASQSALQ
jgi:hypothetical protein